MPPSFAHTPGDLPAEMIKQGVCQIRKVTDCAVYADEIARLTGIAARILCMICVLPIF
jgi:hypothetical protein